MPNDLHVEMNFCRRCGTKLTHKDKGHYVCEQSHNIYLNAAPCNGVLLINDKQEVLLLVRKINPGKGLLDVPGGFCDGAEPMDAATRRELQEEIGLTPDDYGPLRVFMISNDTYEFGDEILPVQCTIFETTIKPGKTPVAGDDAASVAWYALDDIDMNQVFFPVIRSAIERLKSKEA